MRLMKKTEIEKYYSSIRRAFLISLLMELTMTVVLFAKCVNRLLEWIQNFISDIDISQFVIQRTFANIYLLALSVFFVALVILPILSVFQLLAPFVFDNMYSVPRKLKLSKISVFFSLIGYYLLQSIQLDSEHFFRMNYMTVNTELLLCIGFNMVLFCLLCFASKRSFGIQQKILACYAQTVEANNSKSQINHDL